MTLSSLCVIILVATYSGNLMATLAVEKRSLPFHTLSQMADNSEYQVLLGRSNSIYTLFQVFIFNHFIVLFYSIGTHGGYHRTLVEWSPHQITVNQERNCPPFSYG